MSSFKEESLALRPVEGQSDAYENSFPLFHPPGAHAVYGGAAVGQSLAAAQLSMPEDYDVHSMYCNFILPGNKDYPIVYQVERVRDGKSFITRTVHARQRRRSIFVAIISFVKKQDEGASESIEHAAKMPVDIRVPPDMESSRGFKQQRPSTSGFALDERPFEHIRYPINLSNECSVRKERQWIRARGRISTLLHGKKDFRAHQAALAYMSDSYLLGAITRVHNVNNIVKRPTIASKLETFAAASPSDQARMEAYLRDISYEALPHGMNALQNNVMQEKFDDRKVEVIVSLNHTVFFHHPRALKADEWMFTETLSPWASDSRGLVIQHIWSKEGLLIATCTQEGLVRLKQKKDERL